MSNRKSLRVMSFILALALTIGCVSGTMASADTVSDLESEIEKLEKEASKWAEKIKDSRAERKDAQTQKEYLDHQINSVQKQIDLLDDQLSAVNKKIKKKNIGIAKAEKDIVEQENAIKEEYEVVRSCVRDIAKRGTGTELQFLMNTDSYTDYLLKSKLMECISKREEETLNSLEAELSKIETEKEKLEQDKVSLQADKKETETLKTKAQKKQNELDTLYEQSKKLVKELDQDIAAYKKKQKELEKEMEKLEDEIAALQNTSTNQSYKSGSMYWPTPGVTKITSRYGMRWGRLHKGTDISGNSYGKPIVAAADGEVTTATYHKSYGYYVIVDHGYDSKGRRIMTLYAHMSKITTSVGAQVKGGSTQLGKIGSTGNSTGPHLHFEVRVDGKPVDAIAKGYIAVPK